MKIPSKDFVIKRTKGTRDAALDLAALPTQWVWEEKPNLLWNDDIALFDQLESKEILKRTQLRNAAESWQGDLDLIKAITQDVAGFGVLKFAKDSAKLVLFTALKTNGRSRPVIYKQGKAARDAWAEADEDWVIKKKGFPDRTLSAFSSLLTSAHAKSEAHGPKKAAWRRAAAEFTKKIRSANVDCLAWYAEATRYFPAGTAEGDMIRTTVPTTTQPVNPVGRAEIYNLMTSGDTIHFDAKAAHATKFTYLHKAPGQSAFVVLVTDSPESHLTLHGQVPGVHEFKVIGRNSRGEGPESAVVQVMVALFNVA